MANRIENAPDRLGEKNQIGLAGGFSERRSTIDRAGGNGIGHRSRGTHAEDQAVEPRLAQGQAKGGANQARADDSDSVHSERPADFV